MVRIEDTAEKKPNRKLRAERLRRGWTQREIADALYVSADMVCKWESGTRGTSLHYQKQLCLLFGMDAIDLGFMQEPVTEPVPHLHLPASSPDEIRLPLQKPSPSDEPSAEKRAYEEAQKPQLTPLETQRRHLLTTTGALLLVPSPELLFDPSILERFSRVLAKPASIDETLLQYLVARNIQYGEERESHVLAPYALLSYVVEHFQKIVGLLERSLSPSSRMRLCAIAGEAAGLIGRLVYDLGIYEQARSFYKVALQAAQEAHHQELEAVIWGWMSFTWTYSDDYQAALACIQKARRLVKGHGTIGVCTWLAAMEAEILAHLHQPDESKRAIEFAERIADASEKRYGTGFDRISLEGYKGVCFRLLYDPEKTSTRTFLAKAQQSLTGALKSVASDKLGWQTNFHMDLASIYIQQGMIEEAYGHFTTALALIHQIGSQTKVQRLFKVRQELEPWRASTLVRDLDEQMEPLLVPGWYSL